MSFDACADMIARRDPDRFAAAMLAPKESRAHLMALYAFNLEVARAPWVTKEPGIAAIRLQWWRDVLDEIYAGGRVREHEVVQPLAKTIAACDLPQADLVDLIDVRETDLDRKPLSLEQIDSYCARTGGGLMGLGGRVVGANVDALAAFGNVAGIAAFCAAMPRLYAYGWPVYVGGDARWTRDGPNGDLQGVIGGLAQEAAASLREAPAFEKPALPVALAGWQTRRILRLLQSSDGRAEVFSDGFAPSEARRRMTVLFRYMRGRV